MSHVKQAMFQPLATVCQNFNQFQLSLQYILYINNSATS